MKHNQPPNEADGLLTRSELVAQLGPMGMAESLRLVAVDPDGSEHAANVGYSSDLKAFALRAYDDKGNITSWYPLPTRTLNHYKGYKAVETIKYADQIKPVEEQPDRTGQTLYRVENVKK